MADPPCLDESDGLEMKQGSYVTNNKGKKYTICELLGKGGYGAVYKARSEGGIEYAMKVEKKVSKRLHSKLTMEVKILEIMEGSRHFVRKVDKARKTHYYFIVMTLVGESLADLKKQRPGGVFSLPTGLQIGVQTLEGIQEMHKHGYIHRDIKPGNFAIGLGDLSSLIYILDFGIARKVTNESGDIKTPREKVAFKGTLRYASISCHKGQELGFKDDVENWLYMLVDCIVNDGVPWRTEDKRDKIMRMKEDARLPDGKQRLFSTMSVEEFGTMLDYIDTQKYVDKVDYDYIYTLINKAAETKKVSMKDPLDWLIGKDRENFKRQQMEKSLAADTKVQQKSKCVTNIVEQNLG